MKALACFARYYYYQLLLLLLLLCGESEKCTSLKVPRQCPLTRLVNEGFKLGKSLGSTRGC
jgi:hypothetical protein